MAEMSGFDPLKIEADTIAVVWNARQLFFRSSNNDVVCVAIPERKRGADLFRYVCGIAIAQDASAPTGQPSLWTGVDHDFLDRLVQHFRWDLSIRSRDTYWSKLAGGSECSAVSIVTPNRSGASADARELFQRVRGYVLGAPRPVPAAGYRFWSVSFHFAPTSKDDFTKFSSAVRSLLKASSLANPLCGPHGEPTSVEKHSRETQESSQHPGWHDATVFTAEFVPSLPYRRELDGVLPKLLHRTKYELARTVSQLDMLGLNLYVNWFGDSEFVKALNQRDRPVNSRIILPRRDSLQLKMHFDRQSKYLSEDGFYGHYDTTMDRLKKLRMRSSLKHLDDIVVHTGFVRLDNVAFVMPYIGSRRGSNSPVFVIQSETASRLFQAMCDDFNWLWDVANGES